LQKRGKALSSRYRSPSFKFQGETKLQNKATSAKILDIVHCAGHSAPLLKVLYDNGEESYLVAANGSAVGNEIQIGETAKAELGNYLPLKNIPEGSSVTSTSIPSSSAFFFLIARNFFVSKFGSHVKTANRGAFGISLITFLSSLKISAATLFPSTIIPH